jgi:hypothetical protein
MTVRAFLGSALLGAFAAACGDAGGMADGNATSRSEAVFGGELSGPEDDAVVRVVARQPKPYYPMSCTGTLLAPNLLVTALHCVAVFDALGRFECRSNGSLEPSLGGGWIGEPVEPELIDVYFGPTLPPVAAAHGLSVFGVSSTSVCLDDIAFVVLDTALPSRGLPVRIEPRVQKGETMTVIGYGLNETPEVDRARRSGVPVLDVGPDDTSTGLGTAAPRTFILGDGGCVGDNGAPALSDETGAVTGVFAFPIGGECTEQSGARGWFTQLAPYTRLLESAFELAGAEPRTDAQASAAPATRSSGCALGAPAPRGTPSDGALVAFLVLFASRRAVRARSAARVCAPRWS